jgi:DNA polymerase-1
MKIVIDIEANSLVNPVHIWIIACKDIDTGSIHIFRKVTEDADEKNRFLVFAEKVDTWVGHNWLGYDYPVLHSLVGLSVGDLVDHSVDTLVISKLIDYSRKGGHSIEQYGKEFGIEKGRFSDWTKYSLEMEEYCVRDVDICERIYLKYHSHIVDNNWLPSIRLEQSFQLTVNDLHNNGFSFNVKRATNLLSKVTGELTVLDKEIKDAFPPRLRFSREVHPRLTRYGTLNKSDFRFVKGGDLSEYSGDPFCRCDWVQFNASSHKQLIDVLHMAGWVPTEKTTTHIDTERELNRLKYQHNRTEALDIRISELYNKLEQLRKSGWKINEANLATLPETAPSPARTLAKRILLESRRRTLTEWLGLVQPDGRIHGKFYGIGAWTHRMAHQQPNTANIPTDAKLYGNEMRSLWQAPRNRLLVGVDAEGIQLRIFAHYINDKEFTDALVRGKKSDKTDPHSFNKSILGSICKSRQDAKRFIYAYLLGAGIQKLSEVLGATSSETEQALNRLLQRYGGLLHLKKEVIPKDAKRGFFYGLDGRRVSIPGETPGDRKHLVMSGYLQNGEAIIMKKATCLFIPKLRDYNAKLVNLVHDEWQTETPNNMDTVLNVARIQAESLREVGIALELKCPLAGSYWSEDHNDYTVGTNWSRTH